MRWFLAPLSKHTGCFLLTASSRIPVFLLLLLSSTVLIFHSPEQKLLFFPIIFEQTMYKCLIIPVAPHFSCFMAQSTLSSCKLCSLLFMCVAIICDEIEDTPELPRKKSYSQKIMLHILIFLRHFLHNLSMLDPRPHFKVLV